jgi:hypothetical protein
MQVSSLTRSRNSNRDRMLGIDRRIHVQAPDQSGPCGFDNFLKTPFIRRFFAPRGYGRRTAAQRFGVQEFAFFFANDLSGVAPEEPQQGRRQLLQDREGHAPLAGRRKDRIEDLPEILVGSRGKTFYRMT